MKTIFSKPADVKHDWYVIDASGKTLADLILATPNTKAINNDVANCFKYVSTNIFKKS